MSFYYITRADARHELYDRDQSLLMGWQSILLELPRIYNYTLSVIDYDIWKNWCQLMLSARYRTFKALFSEIADIYDLAHNQLSEIMASQFKEFIRIVYRHMLHDYDELQRNKMDDSTLWDLDHNNRELTREFQRAKLLCPLNHSAEAVAERFRCCVRSILRSMDENPIVADDGSIPIKQELPDELIDGFIPAKKHRHM